MLITNTNSFNVRALFELHGIPGLRARKFETMIDPHTTSDVACDDVMGVLTIFNADNNNQVYWTNTSGGAVVKV